MRDKGRKVSTNRTAEETEIGLFWLESSAQAWNRLASAIVGERNKGDVYESARFYGLVNWGLANAGFVGWKAKYTVRFFVDGWRDWRLMGRYPA